MNNNKNHIEQVLTQVIHAQQATERWLPPHLRYNAITLNTKDSSFKRYSMSVEGKKVDILPPLSTSSSGGF